MYKQFFKKRKERKDESGNIEVHVGNFCLAKDTLRDAWRIWNENAWQKRNKSVVMELLRADKKKRKK